MRLATLGLMTAGVAHDLGNHLQVIASALNLIHRRLEESNRQDLHPLAESAQTSVDRAAALSRQILDLSASKASTNEITFPDATVIAMRNLISVIVGSAIEVSVIASKDGPAVLCNGRELENAVLNLVINARDAMPHGGRLTISVYRDEMASNACQISGGPEPKVVICVRDTGCGMSEETIGQVFRPFFTTKAEGRGTGLGLAMVSDFARRSGGSAEIASVLGEGTSVLMRLPCCPS
jgi:signal transduction histidine kinase